MYEMYRRYRLTGGNHGQPSITHLDPSDARPCPSSSSQLPLTEAVPHSPVPQILDALERNPGARRVYTDKIYDRAPTPAPWGVGPVTLLGDAAHPITPNVGQGACMAIEDAACLAKCASRTADLAAAFRDYEDLRRPRTAGKIALTLRRDLPA